LLSKQEEMSQNKLNMSEVNSLLLRKEKKNQEENKKEEEQKELD
jgi:hypothetical protein